MLFGDLPGISQRKGYKQKVHRGKLLGHYLLWATNRERLGAEWQSGAEDKDWKLEPLLFTAIMLRIRLTGFG